jgi:choice-of-anchor B domain-containing protein
MKISLVAFLLLLCSISSSYCQKNITRLGAWHANGQSVAGCWHYVDSLGREYALVGAANGIIILDVNDPALPVFLFQLLGLNSGWHEVKVSGNYAYAVSEAEDPDTLKDGLQIINLSYLPDSAPNYFWHSDGIMTAKLRKAHSITVDDEYIYVNGHGVPGHGNGVLILEKSDPWNPVYVGEESNRYCHDSFVRGDTMWTSDIYNGMFSVYDISDRSNPILLATQQTPNQFNHNAWLSDDSRYLFTTDEQIGAPIGAFDVSDLGNITLVDAYYAIHMQPYEAHNVRVLNDYIINASYGSQVTIIDASRPHNLIEVGDYPTGGANSLCWDADPFLPSGMIIATDKNTDSVYFLSPGYIRACYLEGMVTDSLTGNTINDAKVDIASVGLHDSTNLSGQYKTGYADSGMYMVAFSKPGYLTKTLPAQLNNGVLTVLNVQLVDSSLIGIDPVNREDLVKVENNPSGDQVTFLVSPSLVAQSSALRLTVADASGKIIFDQRNIAQHRIIVQKKDIAAGVYFFSLEDDRVKIAAGKIIFQ